MIKLKNEIMYIVYTKEEQELLKANDRQTLEDKFKSLQKECDLILYKRKKEAKIRSKPLIDTTKKASNGKVVKRKYNINFDYFKEVTLENSYWAGFIAADGSINKSGGIGICLNGKDHNHLEKFKEAVKFEGPIRFYNILTPSGNPTTQSRFYSNVKSYQKDLYENFNICSGNKTQNLEPPQNLTINQSLAYLKGFIDGDGHIKSGPRVKRVEIIGTHSIIEWCKNLVNSVTADLKRNDCSNVRVHHRSKMCSIYQVSGPQFLKLAFILQKLNLPGLERKWSQIPLESDF